MKLGMISCSWQHDEDVIGNMQCIPGVELFLLLSFNEMMLLMLLTGITMDDVTMMGPKFCTRSYIKETSC